MSRSIPYAADLQSIQGYHWSGELTMYYVNDLKAQAIAKYGLARSLLDSSLICSAPSSSSASFAASSSSCSANPALPVASSSLASAPVDDSTFSLAKAVVPATHIAPSPPPTAAPGIAGKKRTKDAFFGKGDGDGDAAGFTRPTNVTNPNPDRARRGNAKASYLEVDDDE